MSKPLIAIVGRPNVGKSMLFNKIIGRRLSIVEDTPGVTRDRIYGESDWNGRKFRLVDTGGIEPNTDNQILAFMREQAQIAIDNANVIIFVTDIKTGMTAADQEVAGMLQRSKKPIVLAVNKMDSTGAVDPDFYEFYNLGLGDPIAVSAVHGHGTGDLLDACLQYFPPEDEEEEDSDVIQVAIIGKPNVGKSSLTNRILGQQRVIVSNVAGTTRDAIDSYFENETGKYNFIDTAGMRKKSKVDDNIEKYSVLRATMAIEAKLLHQSKMKNRSLSSCGPFRGSTTSRPSHRRVPRPIICQNLIFERTFLKKTRLTISGTSTPVSIMSTDTAITGRGLSPKSSIMVCA